MNDSLAIIPPIIVQLRLQEVQFAERRLATQVARLKSRAKSYQLTTGSDHRSELSWWRYY